MKKTILAAVPLAILALAVPSAAQAKRAVTYKGKLAPTAGSAVRGKGSLVDGKRRDKLRLRVRGLEAGAVYTWSLRRAAAGGDACSGDAVASFGYSSVEGRRNVKLRSRARGFNGGSGAYAVVITDAEGEDVACLELQSKAQREEERSEGEDDSAGDEDELGEDDAADGEDELGDDGSIDDDAGEDPVGDEPAGDGEDDGLF